MDKLQVTNRVVVKVKRDFGSVVRQVEQLFGRHGPTLSSKMFEHLKVRDIPADNAWVTLGVIRVTYRDPDEVLYAMHRSVVFPAVFEEGLAFAGVKKSVGNLLMLGSYRPDPVRPHRASSPFFAAIREGAGEVRPALIDYSIRSGNMHDGLRYLVVIPE